MAFTLHPTLKKDTVLIGNLDHCRVLLMNNRHFPWLVLVPAQNKLRELHDLTLKDLQAVMKEIRTTSERFSRVTDADKMNVAALGNIVPQLHIHIIARFIGDAAWPNPVWNAGPAATPYPPASLAQVVKKLKKSLLV